MNNFSEFAKRVKKSREDNHWTQETLAKRSGISLGTIRRIEQETDENTKFPRSDTIVKLAMGLDVTPAFLLDGLEKEEDSYMMILTNELKNLSSDEIIDYHDKKLSGKNMKYLKLSEKLITEIRTTWNKKIWNKKKKNTDKDQNMDKDKDKDKDTPSSEGKVTRSYVLETIVRYVSNRPE